MNKRHAGRQSTALLIMLIGLIAAGSFAAVAAFGGERPAAPVSPAPVGTPAPAPSDEPAPVGTPTPAPATPAPAPSATPSLPPVDAMPINVLLDTLGTGDVSVDIVDDDFGVVEAVTGTPTGGASVDMDTLHVENIDARTLRLTWVDRPGDSSLALFIDRTDGQIVLVRPEHDLDGDAVVLDRVLILTFRDPIAADSIVAVVQDGLDTPG